MEIAALGQPFTLGILDFFWKDQLLPRESRPGMLSFLDDLLHEPLSGSSSVVRGGSRVKRLWPWSGLLFIILSSLQQLDTSHNMTKIVRGNIFSLSEEDEAQSRK